MPQIQIFISEDNRLTLDLAEAKVTVGRLPENTLHVDDGSVSSHHAEIVFEGGKHHLHDLGSTNGTFVNEEQVQDAILNHGDEVRFGRIPAVYTAEEENGNSQPLPEAAGTTAEVARNSARPESFVSSSPAPRGGKSKDPLAGVLYAGFALAVAACGAAIYFTLSLQ